MDFRGYSDKINYFIINHWKDFWNPKVLQKGFIGVMKFFLVLKRYKKIKMQFGRVTYKD